jgi:uncharacterized protein
MRFDRHTVVLLSGHRTRPSCPTRSWRHYKTLNLASQAELHAQGYMLAAGPFNGQHDERLGGISVMSVDPEQARRLYAHDPAEGS